jgi:hypothetical protein
MDQTLEYYQRMKSTPNEYARFTGALKKVLQVSHSELKQRLDAEKQAKKQQPKPSSGHASSEKG